MIHSESDQVPEPFQTSSPLQTSRPRHTQCGTVVDRLLDLSGPFKTKAWVSSNCALQQPGSRRTVETVAAILQQLLQTLPHPPWTWGRAFSGLEDRCASARPEMSIKRRLLSMLLCCVYCVASLFCLHPNRHNCFSSGAR